MKVLKIGAVWCSGCLVMKPIWKKIEEKMPELDTQYFDVDEDADKIEKLNIDINRMPTFIFLDKEGNELERLTGEIAEDKILETIEKYNNK